ncbi:MAG TPA: hypothetical protein VF893_01550 [Candidatus Bathyarchaeia archaeon]
MLDFEVNVKSGVKEEMMKKFIYVIVSFIFVLILIGCFATMTPEQRKETYDLRKEVGEEPFVGSPFARWDASGFLIPPPY